MRIFLHLIFPCFLLLNFQLTSAQNLVPNPSFEDTVYCPTGVTQITACENWSSFGNTPDYFNVCNITGMSVPNSVFGFQYAHSGNAMTGLITYRRPNTPNGPNYREYIGAQLIFPTVTGVKYYFSFYINFGAQLPPCVATNKAGIRFSTQAYSTNQMPPLTNWAHAYTDSILSDSINWVRIEGTMIADSAYNYVQVGNFFDDTNTDTMHVGAINDYGYYYIDDVCLTADSLYNNLWTGLNNFSINAIGILQYTYSENLILVTTEKKIVEFELYNLSGQKINSINNRLISENVIELNRNILVEGMYLIKIKFQTNTIIRKILTFK